MLAFDTATPAVTVALHDGERVLAERTTVDARRQGELLATAIGAVLAEAGLDRTALDVVVAGVGPGPYTGLRAGLVTAQVLASALDIPLHGVCTLDVIARDAATAAAGREFLVATDARRREVYWARYSPTGIRLAGPEVAAPAALPAGLPAAGEGPIIYPETLGEAIGPAYPAAATLAAMAGAAMLAGVGAASAADNPSAGAGEAGGLLLPPLPLYLRRPDARVPGPPKRVTPAAARRKEAGG